jgi:branched-chain amino acid transport system permease protein
MVDVLRRNRAALVTAGVVVLLLVLLSRQYEPRVTASIVLSGLTLGALYFLVTAGLSLIFGLMDVLNFAHGTLFMVGAYAGYTLYPTPRIILTPAPFALVLGGGALLGAWVARRWGGRVPAGLPRWITWAAALLGALLLLPGLGGFDLLKLAASSAIASGGAVPTAVAQEPDGAFALRLIWLVPAGVLFGVATGLHTARRPGAVAPGGRRLLMGVALIALAAVLVPLRTPGETWILGLSSNLRFLLALLIGAGTGAALGAGIEWSMIRPLYTRPIYQVLLTLGLVFVGTEAVKGIWGPAGFYMDIPAFFNSNSKNCPSPDLLAWFSDHCASIDVMGRPFPSYRIFIIVLGLLIFVAIALLLKYTRMGMIIRAGVQDSEMVQALGINVRRVFTLVFALGAGLAALGGVAAAPFIGLSPNLGQDFLLLAFIAVVIGGMGSYPGAAIGALLVGLARAFGDQLVLSGVHLPGMEDAIKFSPSIARASTVLLMAVVLLVRPAGLFGRKE